MNGPQNALETRIYGDNTNRSTQRKVAQITKDNYYNQSDS